MIKKFAVLMAAATTAFALLPTVTASADHLAGGHATSCFYRSSTAYNGVQVTVDGIGSDSPRNALIAAAARVSVSSACNRAGGVPIVRVQIDSVRLLHGSSVYKIAGPAAGYTTVYKQTAGKNAFPCDWNLRVYAQFSTTYSDGSRAGGTTFGPYFRRC